MWRSFLSPPRSKSRSWQEDGFGLDDPGTSPATVNTVRLPRVAFRDPSLAPTVSVPFTALHGALFVGQVFPSVFFLLWFSWFNP